MYIWKIETIFKIIFSYLLFLNQQMCLISLILPQQFNKKKRILSS